ncbi:MAG TPA: LysE family transporter [Cytophagaceae bacterium]|jgi:threonine/homoserine/homoserine lactone efflux protein|nr:LysE family transporter [Cytophagaceae bacterium]
MNIPDFIIYFSLALTYSFFGSMPPATGNLLTIQLSITRGLKAALIFALGEVIIEFIYGYVAWLISDFITEKTNYDFHLKVIAIPIFLIMALYFFISKKPIEKETEIKQNRNFIYGLLIGVLNPLAIPFWVVNISYFFSNDWIKKDSSDFWFFIAGIPVGSFLLLFVYALLGKKIYSILKFRIELLNRVIAIIFILLAVLQTILLLNG